MKTNILLTLALSALLGVAFTTQLHAQTTAFTYQGSLSDNGNPASGIYDLRFALYAVPTNGVAINAVTNAATAVSGGLFTVTLDFGSSVFDGGERWLEIGVVTNGGGAFSTLTPRQLITATPYAVRALTIDSGALAGPFSDAVSFSNPANTFTGSFAGDGSSASNVNALTLGGLTATNFWQLDGNAATTPGVNYLGTSDGAPLELRVNNQRVVQFLTTRSNEVYNLLGGSPHNYINPAVIGATISGGGAINWLGAAQTNSLASDFGTIGGGAGNTIRTNSNSTVISGGLANTIQEDSYAATIAGGRGNSIGTNSWQSFIAGGDNNHIRNNTSLGTISGGSGHTIGDVSWRSTIGGGYVNEVGESSQGALIGGGFDNFVGTNSDYSVVGGGALNVISNETSFSVIAGGVYGFIGTNSWYTVISGGRENSVEENAHYATAGGGYGNVIQPNAEYSIIAGGEINRISTNSMHSVISGGRNNDIGVGSSYSMIGGGRNNNADGNYSFAVGRQAKALHDGAFVWADSSGLDFQSLAVNEFAVRAAGGVRFETGGSGLSVDGLPVLAGSVGTSAIADGSVTTAKLANGSVVSSKIAEGAVSRLGTPDGSNTGVVTVNDSGRVGIGTGNPLSQLHVRHQAIGSGWGVRVQNVSINTHQAGMRVSDTGFFDVTNDALDASPNFARLDSGGNWTIVSDRRLKRDIQPLSGVLLRALALEPVNFSYKNDEATSDNKHIGFIAQDVRKQFPSLVTNGDVLTLNYAGLSVVAISALQELNQKVEQKETEITELKTRMEKLEQLLNEKINGGAQ